MNIFGFSARFDVAAGAMRVVFSITVVWFFAGLFVLHSSDNLVALLAADEPKLKTSTPNGLVPNDDDGTDEDVEASEPPIRIIGPDDKPVQEAWVSVGAYGDSEKSPAWSPYSPHGTSGDDGAARLQGRVLPAGPIMIYARHEGRNLSGLQSFDRAVLLAGVEMKLHPACRVHGTLESSTLRTAGRKLGWTNVYLHVGDARPLSFMSKENRFEFFLPPGKYKLNAYGTDTKSVEREIEVTAGQREMAVNTIDLPATKLAMLIGKQAPELLEIKEWSNTPPTSLKEMQGKYVLLTFWGHWCGPCMGEMAHLMKLHDDYGDRGLVVLGVHDSSVKSIAEMEEKLTTVRNRQWWGRGIAFPIALDGDGEIPSGEKRPSGRGATTEAFGITKFPTSLLIDREGTIVSEEAAWDANLPAKLERLLGTEGEVSTWRKRLGEVYQLDQGQIVRRIAPPFIPERTQLITSDYNAATGVGTLPNRLTLTWDGKLHRANAGGTALIDVLRSFTEWGTRDDLIDCPPKLAKTIIPGDWIVAADAPLAERFSAVEAILKLQLRQQIRLFKAQVEREVIVISGTYEFHPLRPDDKSIHFSTNDDDLDDDVGGSGGDIQKFVIFVTTILQSQCIDETTDSEKFTSTFLQHPSAILARPAPSKDVDQILAKLSKQTSWKFERQRRLVDVWMVRETP